MVQRLKPTFWQGLQNDWHKDVGPEITKGMQWVKTNPGEAAGIGGAAVLGGGLLAYLLNRHRQERRPYYAGPEMEPGY